MENCLSVGAVHRESKQKFKEKERNNCPAFGKECDFCHIKNHFESKCLKKKYKRDVQEITEEMGEIREEQPGKDLILADALSRAYVIHNEEDDFDKDIESQICLTRRDEVKYFIELDIEPEKRETQNNAYLCMNSGNDSDEDAERKIIEKTTIMTSGRISKPPPGLNQFEGGCKEVYRCGWMVSTIDEDKCRRQRAEDGTRGSSQYGAGVNESGLRFVPGLPIGLVKRVQAMGECLSCGYEYALSISKIMIMTGICNLNFWGTCQTGGSSPVRDPSFGFNDANTN
ncbi:hypothetical protein HUJ04_012044 [Dendroctonus ponderosae]|nr:hypothetical protein HUJ04_012044 [Dendroctonus ponderosae]